MAGRLGLDVEHLIVDLDGDRALASAAVDREKAAAQQVTAVNARR